MGTSKGSVAALTTASGRRRSLWVLVLAVLLSLSAAMVIAGGIGISTRLSQALSALPEEADADSVRQLLIGVILATLIVGGVFALLIRGLLNMKNWARTGVMLVAILIVVYFWVGILFDVSKDIFGGERIVPMIEILELVALGLLQALVVGLIPGAVVFLLIKLGEQFEASPEEKAFVDRAVRYLLLATALSAIFVVFLIIVFTLMESWESIEEIGLDTMLLGTVWRPGSIIGTDDAQLGLVPMIVGSVLSTFGAAILGVPLSLATAILLAEIAPPLVRETVRPAIELLAGIPSVVYGLFGMVVLAPLIRKIEIPYNTGFGLLNASIILAVMIIPTVTNIAEDAIRAVPRAYKEGSFAMGATHWQTIRDVILPAARSGIVAAVILGIGRALGETMAMIMVIGNSIAIPAPLTNNPLTIILSSARTLTGNIAVEINYAAGAHRSALFFTGVLLFIMILMVNTLARYLMRERSPS